LTRTSSHRKVASKFDKDVLAIDLRQPDRVVLRLSEEAVAARAEMVKARPKLGKGSPV
jgi:cell division protein FtsQ